MNYPNLTNEYRKLLKKYYPVDFTNPNPELENDLSNLIFLIEIDCFDIDQIMANILWDFKRMQNNQLKKKIIEEQKMNKDVEDLLKILKNND